MKFIPKMSNMTALDIFDQKQGTTFLWSYGRFSTNTNALKSL